MPAARPGGQIPRRTADRRSRSAFSRTRSADGSAPSPSARCSRCAANTASASVVRPAAASARIAPRRPRPRRRGRDRLPRARRRLRSRRRPTPTTRRRAPDADAVRAAAARSASVSPRSPSTSAPGSPCQRSQRVFGRPAGRARRRRRPARRGSGRRRRPGRPRAYPVLVDVTRPSAVLRRSRETSVCSAARAPRGGASPHSSSMSASVRQRVPACQHERHQEGPCECPRHRRQRTVRVLGEDGSEDGDAGVRCHGASLGRIDARS